MKNYMIALLAALALVGCGTKAQPVPPSPLEQFNSDLIKRNDELVRQITKAQTEEREGKITPAVYASTVVRLAETMKETNASNAIAKTALEHADEDAIQKGLKPRPAPEMTQEQKELMLAKLQLKIAEVKAREAQAERPTIIERVIEKVLVVPAPKTEVRVLTADAGRPQWERVTLDECNWTVYHERTK